MIRNNNSTVEKSQILPFFGKYLYVKIYNASVASFKYIDGHRIL